MRSSVIFFWWISWPNLVAGSIYIANKKKKINKRNHQKSRRTRLCSHFNPDKRIFHLSKNAEKVTITLEEMIANGDLFQCFVSEAANKDIVGFASFFFAYYSWNGKSIYLDDLYVTDAYRKQGIGKLLLEEIVALAKKSDCKKLRWQVSKWNTNAIDFYKRMNAAIDDTEINCDLLLV